MSGEAKLRYVNDAIKVAYGSRLSTGFASHTVDNLKPVAANVWYRLSPRPGAVAEIATGLVLSIGGFAWFRHRARSGAARGRGRFAGSPEWWAMLIVGALVALQFVVALLSLPGHWLYSWYADPVFAAVAGGLGLGLVAAAVGRTQPNHRWTTPALGLALVAVWASIIAPLHSAGHRFDGTRWPGRVGSTNVQFANVEAAAWLHQARLPGRIGAYDNGWLSFSLDPTPVENLDGLANSYRYFALLQNRQLGLFDVYRVERLRYLVTWAQPGRVPPCAHRLWRSSAALSNGVDPTSGRPPASFPIAVFDLVACASAPRP